MNFDPWAAVREAERRVADPESGALVLDPRAPLDTAKAYLQTTLADGIPTIAYWRGQFHSWRGSGWRPLAESDVRARLYAYLDRARQKKESDLVPFAPNARKVGEILDALRAIALLDSDTAAPAWLDQVPDLCPPPEECIALANGILHLPSRELLPPTPRLFTLNAVDVPYDAAARRPEVWLRFLDSLWPDDGDAIAALQEWLAYCLTPDTRQQKAMLMVGPKRSGKGTIARVLRQLVGTTNVVAPTLASLGSNFGLSPLIEASLAIVGDARLDGRAGLAVIAERLLSITGEDALTVDRKYLPAWSGQLRTRFMLLSNELPQFNDASGALASRFIVLTMRRSFFGQEDLGLLDRVLPELPGILNWAADGWDRLRGRGYFVQPASSDAAVENLEAMASPIISFVRECCDLGPTCEVIVDMLFEMYGAWANRQGMKAGTSNLFSRNLSAAYPAITTYRPGSSGPRARVFRGIRPR